MEVLPQQVEGLIQALSISILVEPAVSGARVGPNEQGEVGTGARQQQVVRGIVQLAEGSREWCVDGGQRIVRYRSKADHDARLKDFNLCAKVAYAFANHVVEARLTGADALCD